MISDLAQQIDNLLPQTQCTKCGFSGCAPYARAIAEGSANFNQCPPGGQEGVDRLARLLGRPAIALNPENGVERPRPIAVIDESVCIGCTLCIQACPTDAIAGAAKLMHTVIEANCTGCDLCVAPCPVDCITMVPLTGQATGWQAWSPSQAEGARLRHERKLARQAAEKDAADQRAAARIALADAAVKASEAGAQGPAGQAATASAGSAQTGDPGAGPAVEASAVTGADEEQARKNAIIQAAIERARQRRLSANVSVQDADPTSRPKPDHER